MTAPGDLERLCRASPQCLGIAWLTGSPLAVTASSGEPSPATNGDASAASPSWDAIAQLAPVVLHDGPIASPEVLLRLPGALVLLAERAAGVVAVAVALTPAGTGVALVQARMAASQVAT
jgi:hypothetical protein